MATGANDSSWISKAPRFIWTVSRTKYLLTVLTTLNFPVTGGLSGGLYGVTILCHMFPEVTGCTLSMDSEIPIFPLRISEAAGNSAGES